MPIRRVRALLLHPAVRSFVFERVLLSASAALAAGALLFGVVAPSEVLGLLDARLLALFFVLTLAVSLAKESDLLDALVLLTIRRARTARQLAVSMVLLTGVLAALVTNDVVLLLVIPFTLLFRRVTDLDLAPLVVLEVAAANLLGCVTPLGNPQNLFLFTTGRFTPRGFVEAQAPFALGSTVLLLALVPLLVPRRELTPPEADPFDVDLLRGGAAVVLMGLEVASLFGGLSPLVPLAAAVPAALLLGGRLRSVDFSLVFVFAFLFVAVEGLRRGPFFALLDPERIFGHRPAGLALSGSVLSQVVSNVPAALLLAPSVETPAGWTGLLYGVSAGGTGTPIGSLANLIGLQLFLQEGGDRRRYWPAFWKASIPLFVGTTLLAVALASRL